MPLRSSSPHSPFHNAAAENRFCEAARLEIFLFPGGHANFLLTFVEKGTINTIFNGDKS